VPPCCSSLRQAPGDQPPRRIFMLRAAHGTHGAAQAGRSDAQRTETAISVSPASMCDQAFTHTRSLSGSDLELQSLSPNCPPNRASSKQSRRTHLLTTGGCKPVIETYPNNVVADGHAGPCIDRGRRHVEIARILQADVKGIRASPSNCPRWPFR
jgi:hypothetical protein